MSSTNPATTRSRDALSALVRNVEVGVAEYGAGLSAARVLYAAVMIGLGLRGLFFGDFAGVWQHVPLEHMPGREAIAYACASIELAGGVGLLFKATVRAAAASLGVYLLLWIVLLKLPPLAMMPWVEVMWLGLAEISVVLAGAWVALAAQTPERGGFFAGFDGVRHARILFIAALPAIGLSHFVYATATAGFVPAWLPWHVFWAYLTGAGSLVAACALLFGIVPRLAATLEAAMLSVITLLVWLPGVLAGPSDESWTALLISSAIAAGAWLVADSYRAVAWLCNASMR